MVAPGSGWTAADLYEELAGLLEHAHGLPRARAEQQARQQVHGQAQAAPGPRPLGRPVAQRPTPAVAPLGAKPEDIDF